MKGCCVFAIPGSLSDRNASIGMKRAPEERKQAVEAEEHGRGAVNGKVGPLALGFDPQAGPALLESRFQAPAFHESAHDLLGGLRLVGGKQRFGGSLSLGITGENPADGQRVKIPQSSPGTDLQRPFSLSIPGKSETLPGSVFAFVSREGRRGPTT